MKWQAIAEDWELLADEWAASDTGLIAEVDCTADEAQDLCADVDGFPTIRYGEPTSLDDYPGQREFADMSTFAKENLKPSCGLNNMDLCDEGTKKEITKFLDMSTTELEDLANDVYNKIEEMEKAAGEEITEIEKQINAIIDKFTKDSEAFKKESNFKFLLAALRSKEPEDEDDENENDEL